LNFEKHRRKLIKKHGEPTNTWDNLLKTTRIVRLDGSGILFDKKQPNW
jgi:hypothetical protein